MSILVTGSAGFIGYHVCRALLARGESVIGVDNLNDYYDVRLKKARLGVLEQSPAFSFYPFDISHRDEMLTLADRHRDVTEIVHLAAQAGVRYSLENPFVYAESNVIGHLVILEMSRRLPQLKHLVYASSSSVYGANTQLPFSIADRVDTPISLYAATKKSCELMSYCYGHLYGLPITGLRYFTVYGPWGRPDMSAFLFTKALFEGRPLPVYNHGDMRRNFSYIDDVVDGTLRCLDKPPKSTADNTSPPVAIYNVGNNRSEPLLRFIEVLEQVSGKKAQLSMEPMQPGDVKETIADITETTRDFGFLPSTNIETGLDHFVQWYRAFYHAE